MGSKKKRKGEGAGNGGGCAAGRVSPPRSMSKEQKESTTVKKRGKPGGKSKQRYSTTGG